MIDTTSHPDRRAPMQPALPPSRIAPIYLPLGIAAARLSLSSNALRARCRRAAKRLSDGRVVAGLGAGVVGVKFGKSWRICFPPQ
jgi:hypothetical protein